MRTTLFPWAFLLVALTTLLAPVATAAEPAQRKPNIIFIMADDLGYGDLGCYGQQEIRTPHIDRLANEGTRFMQCYAGSTVCAPTRCVLLTGKHTGHCRVRGNSGFVGPDRVKKLLKLDDWNEITIVAKENNYTVWLNGIHVLSWAANHI